MQIPSMESLVAAGAVVGGIIVGLWQGLRGGRKAAKPLEAKQDETLAAVNLTRRDLQLLGEHVDARMDDLEHRTDSRLIDLAQRVGTNETHIAEIRGEVRAFVAVALPKGTTEGAPVARGEPVADPPPPRAQSVSRSGQ